MSGLPRGWVETSLAEISGGITYGFTTKSSTVGEGARLLRITDIQDYKVDWASLPYCDDQPDPAFLVRSGDIVVARTGATTGKSYLIRNVPVPTAFASYLIRIAVSHELQSDYIWKFMQGPVYWQQIQVVSKGTAQPGANAVILGQVAIPLPPLAEQKRIVAKLDALNAKSARARTELARIETLVSRYKQAVLSKAFNGELVGLVSAATEKPHALCWDLPFGWRWVAFEEAVEIASNLVNPNTIPDLPHIAPDNIESGTTRLLPYRTIKENGVISAKHRFYAGQILYSKIRPYLRKAVIADFDGACSADMYPLAPRDVLAARYLLQWLVGEQFTHFAVEHQGRTVLPKINQNALNKTPLPLPPLAVQHEIVRRIESAFAKINRLAKEAKRALELVGRLDEAILAKAFRGELVPQDENDEPAELLLARIRAERETAPKGKRGRGSKG